MANKMYISGKITGLPMEDVIEKFQLAETHLKMVGFDPVNPLKLHNGNTTQPWEVYMITDIAALFECQGIYMLSNWKNSKGARIEHTIAVETGKRIFYQ